MKMSDTALTDVTATKQTKIIKVITNVITDKTNSLCPVL